MEGINDRSIQMLWRWENDSKQSDEFQATEESSLQLKTQRMIKTRMCVSAPKLFNKATIALGNRARSKRTQITVREQNKFKNYNAKRISLAFHIQALDISWARWLLL